MCGLVGFVNFKTDDHCFKPVIEDMNHEIRRRGPDEEGYFFDENIALGHKRLIVVDPEGGKQPMTEYFCENQYTIVYNGQLYNTEDLRNELKTFGFHFESHSDTEVLLKSFINWGPDVLSKLNGIFAFAIWNHNKKELFLARDHFGVKPLYYTICDDTLIFASEVKSIFKYPSVSTVVTKEGLCELFGLGPAHTPGMTPFKNIYEIKPAHFAIYNQAGFHICLLYTSRCV